MKRIAPEQFPPIPPAPEPATQPTPRPNWCFSWRPPEWVRELAFDCAEREGLSMNQWLTRAAARQGFDLLDYNTTTHPADEMRRRRRAERQPNPNPEPQPAILFPPVVPAKITDQERPPWPPKSYVAPMRAMPGVGVDAQPCDLRAYVNDVPEL